jgi:hypothetical protein
MIYAGSHLMEGMKEWSDFNVKNELYCMHGTRGSKWFLVISNVYKEMKVNGYYGVLTFRRETDPYTMC